MTPSKPQRRRARTGRRPARLLLALLISVAGAANAAVPLDPETEQLLVEAVEAAAALDFFNARCRSDNSGRHMDNLNKEIVGKLRVTVISVQDDLFPERGYRQAQQRMQEQFITALREAGGCKGAKDSGLRDRLQTLFREKLEAVEDLP
jgi:hypothetical protein